MSISRTQREGHSTVIRIPPQFDFKQHVEFRRTVDHILEEGRASEIVIDFVGTHSVDSAGLGMLLNLRDVARGAGRNVVLTNASGAVRQMLETAQFKNIFEIR